MGEHDLLAGLNFGDGGSRPAFAAPAGGASLAERVDNSADSLEAYMVDRWLLTPDWTLVTAGSMSPPAAM